MRVLLIDVDPVLLPPLRRSLAARHEVLAFDGAVIDAETCAAAADCDVVVQGYRLAGSDTDADADDLITRATYGTWNVLTTTRATRYVQLTTMRVFDAYDPGWAVDEGWQPHPSTHASQLAAHLAEIASREISRSRGTEVLVLRLDDLADDLADDVADDVAGDPGTATGVAPIPTTTGVSVTDAVSAIVTAVELTTAVPGAGRWQPVHIVSGPGRYRLGRAARPPFDFRPSSSCAASPPATSDPEWPAAPQPVTGLPRPRRLTVFGAGGPLGATTFRALADDHVLRLTDRQPLAELAALPPQSPDAPRPAPVAAPHDEQVVDVTDLDAVLAAADGADALINLTVVRHQPQPAFAVNVLGAYHMMLAAARFGIRRVVQTGPAQVLAPHPLGYFEDRRVTEEAPARAGDGLYFLTKLLGQEICRIFAAAHQIACPVLLLCALVDPTFDRDRLHAFAISWADAGRAVAAAATVTELPEPSPVLHLLAPSPHDRYTTHRAQQVLGWAPRDRLDHLWRRR